MDSNYLEQLAKTLKEDHKDRVRINSLYNKRNFKQPLPKLHNLEIGQTVYDDGIKAIVEDFVDELTVQIRGLFGQHHYWQKEYKNKFFKFLGIGKYVYKKQVYQKTVIRSYYMLETKKEVKL